MKITNIVYLALICLNLISCAPNFGYEKTIIPEDISSFPEYKEVTFYENDVIGVKNGLKSGFSDKENNLLIPMQYEDVTYFSEDLAAVRANNKYGYINIKNEIVIPFEYDSAQAFKDGCAIVKKNNLYGVIDKNGNQVISCIYEYMNNEIYSDKHKVFTVQKNKKTGLVDINGNIIIPPIYDELTNKYSINKSESFMVAQLGDKYGVIDYSGELLLPLEYEYAAVAGENILSLKKDGKHAVVDVSGNIIIPYSDKGNEPIGEGFFMRGSIFDESGVALYNGNGEEIVKAGLYTYSFAYSNGYIVAMKNGKCGLLNFDGTKATKMKYDNISPLSDGNFAVNRNGKWGIWKNGKETMLDYKLTDITSVDEDGYIYGVNRNQKKVYVFSSHGKVTKCFEGSGIGVIDKFSYVIVNEDGQNGFSYRIIPINNGMKM